jgi:hypothetical protein
MKLNQKIIYSGYTTNDSPANDRHYSLISTRRLVEKIMGQFSGRFSIKKNSASDLFYFINRMAKKGFSHTIAIAINDHQKSAPAI